MAHSLKITHKQMKDGETISTNGGITTTSVELNSEGTTKPYEIMVYVDNDEVSNNQSFKITRYNEWFSYWVERHEKVNDTDDEFVKIMIEAPKNLDTLDRYGELIINHNSSPLSIYVNITQKPTVYSLDVKYDSDGIFNEYPDELFEEKILTISANGGSGKWYVKDIEQYETSSKEINPNEATSQDKVWEVTEPFIEGEKTYEVGDLLTDETYYDDSQISQENKSCCRHITNKEDDIRVEYDGVFNYRIEGNKLIVKSFGRIDMSQSRMRYYFRIAHKDINNVNGKYNNMTYEINQLFIFKPNAEKNIKTYEEGFLIT